MNNKQSRYNAQKNQLLQLIQTKANRFKQTTMSINLDEARAELRQSFTQIQVAFKNLVKDNAITIIKKHYLPNEVLYTIQLKQSI